MMSCPHRQATRTDKIKDSFSFSINSLPPLLISVIASPKLSGNGRNKLILISAILIDSLGFAHGTIYNYLYILIVKVSNKLLQSALIQ